MKTNNPEDIRKVIYTTNAIESLNSVIRKAVKNRKVFPHNQAALKVVYLADRCGGKEMVHANPELERRTESFYD